MIVWILDTLWNWFFFFLFFTKHIANIFLIPGKLSCDPLYPLIFINFVSIMTLLLNTQLVEQQAHMNEENSAIIDLILCDALWH